MVKILVTGGGGFIGTNFLELALQQGYQILDLSLNRPLNPHHLSYWDQADILEAESLKQKVVAFAPDAVVHLAARAECDEGTTIEAGYQMNTEGTANVLAAVRATPSVKRLIVASSQYVCGPGRMPMSDEDYYPATVYGASKVVTERLTRAANLDCTWTIVRPTNVWGPWHMRYSQQFWRIAKRGLYVHPGGAPIIRSYAYVGTVVDQILGILDAEPDRVHRRTLYTTDAPDDIYHWANAFCIALAGRPARRVPRAFFKLAGACGDIISGLANKEFYITSSRARSMVTSYSTPYRETFELLGASAHSLEEGVAKTVDWLQTEVKEFGGRREF